VAFLFFESLLGKKIERTQCLLSYLPWELEELKVGFNCIQKTSNLHAKNVFYCSCEEVCQVIDDCSQGCIISNLTFLSLTKTWECIVCPQDEFSKWHKRKCVMGDYDLCGIDNLPIFLIEEERSSNAIINGNIFLWSKLLLEVGRKKRTKTYLQVYYF